MTALKRIVFSLFCLLAVYAASWTSGAFAAAPGNPAKIGRFTLFFTSDVHGALRADDKTVGLARIAAVNDAEPNSLLLDAGDFLHGAPLATHTQGRDVVRLMKLAGYFAAAAGNHEFAYAFNVLQERLAEAAAPPQIFRVLSANVHDRYGRLRLAPETETEIAGIRICFFGLTTPKTPQLTHKANTEGLNFGDPLEAARTTARAQRGRGCGIIVTLGHIGAGTQSSPDSLAIMQAVPEIDIFIDGHSHKQMEHITGTRALLNPGSHGTALGKLDVTYDKTEGVITSLKNSFLGPDDLRSIMPDQLLTHEIDRLDKEVNLALSTFVGYASTTLDGDRKLTRTTETPLGNLLADAMRMAYGDPIAILNSGAIRDSLHQGPIIRRDVLCLIPFNDPIISFTISGAELVEILEHGLSHLPDPDGGFPQISGLVLRIRPGNPPGKRLLSAHLENGAPLVPAKNYNVSVTGFMASGGDGYPHLASKPRRKGFALMHSVLRGFLRHADCSAYAEKKPVRIIYETE